MGFKYLVKEHAREGMMMQTLQNGILKMNHLLSNELFKKWKHVDVGGDKRSHVALRCCWKRNVLLLTYT
jgi:hypothetical protein